jgi:hypothetical protein
MVYQGLNGRTGNIAPQNLSLSQRLRTYGTTDISRITAGATAPSESIVNFQTGSAMGAIGNYSRYMAGLTQGREFGFEAQPVTWQDIRSREVSAQAAADEALGYNEANLGRYTELARELTRADVSTRTDMLDQFVPDWRQKRDAASAINDSLMRGEIPKDVADQLQRSAAFAAVMGGGGAGVARSLTARDLGTTSLALQQQGMAGAERWTQMMAGLMPDQTTAAGVMATQGMTPQMALQTALENASRQLQVDTTNITGRTQTALQSQQLGLSAASARTAAEQGWANIAAGAAGTALQGTLSTVAADYASRMNAAATAFGNLNRPYQSYREGLGLTSGQRQRIGFGL